MTDDPPSRNLRRIPTRPEVVRDLVQRLALDTGNIQWRVHAQKRMVERGITDEMAVEVLRRGDLKGEVEPRERPGELKVKMVRAIKGRNREVGVVAIVVSSVRLRVITVEWEDVR
jgi:Domain of unknown function (DUF4258)